MSARDRICPCGAAAEIIVHEDWKLGKFKEGHEPAFCVSCHDKATNRAAIEDIDVVTAWARNRAGWPILATITKPA